MDPVRRPAFLAAGWWLTPFEIRGANRLPRVHADLLGVTASPDGKQVIAVGRKGTIVVSDDGGLTWKPERIRDGRAAVPTPSASPAPVPPVVPAASNMAAPAADAAASSGPAGTRAAEEEIKRARLRAEAEKRRREAELKRAKQEKQENQEKQEIQFKQENQDKQEMRPRPESGKEKAGATPFDWIIGQAHAVERPEEASPNAGTNVPRASSQDDEFREDLVGLEGVPPTVVAWSDRAEAFRRDATKGWSFDHRFDALPDRPGEPDQQRYFSVSAAADALALLPSGGPVLVQVAAARTTKALQGARAVRVTGNGKFIDCVAGPRVYRWATPGWSDVGSPAPADLRGVFFLDERRGWVLGGQGEILRTIDGGRSWSPSADKAPVPLNAATFLADARTGFLVGNDGFIATTDDAGATFLSRTCPRTLAVAGAPLTFPPPWYGLSWMLALGLFFLGRSIPAARDGRTELAVEPAFASDRPLERGEPDVLNLSGLAAGLSRFLRNEETRPPLTIAITGPWGTGKSSLMNLLRTEMRSFGFSPVWFNAWHHQKEEQLLAALLQAIRAQAIPAVWRLEGLLFRLHLLLIRARKHALLILGLLFATGVLLASETRNTEHTYEFAQAWKAVRAWLTFLIDPKGEAPKDMGFGGIQLASLGATATLLVGLIRSLRAFGLNPGALLATAGGSIKMRDLDAKSSFREKFRGEYNEVTRALGVRTLILFVDDLDRCQPQLVLDVLESINYLVTSGECFVIMGVDRTRVEPCVALGFKDISAEVSGSEDRVHRQAYAAAYLDKLINIEVAIPRLGPKDAQAILVPRAARNDARNQGEPDGSAAWRQLRNGVGSIVEIFRPSFRLWPLAVAALALFSGFEIERHLWSESAGDGTGATSPEKGMKTVGGAGAGDGKTAPPVAGAVPDNSAGPDPRPGPATLTSPGIPETSDVMRAISAEIARRPAQLGRFDGPSTGSVPIASAFWVLLVAWAGFLIVQVARLRPELVVRDSDEFVAAWRHWYPIIFEKATTPRALKRFQNRVRFLSMRQGADTDDRGWVRQLLDLVRARPAAVPKPAGRPGEGPPPEETVIPDPVLVVLAAIHQSRGDLFDDVGSVDGLTKNADLRRIVDVVRQSRLELPTVAGERSWDIESVAKDIITYRAVFLSRQGRVEVH